MSLKKESRADAQLHAAAFRGYLFNLCNLLDSGRVHVDSRDKDGNTPLILAASAGHFPCCRELLKQGADPCLRRHTGASALFIAAQGGYNDIVRILIRAGAVIDAQCKDGGTALMIAAQCGYADVVRHLLDNGANINLHMKDGANCLFLASQNGQAKIVAMILDHLAHTIPSRVARNNYVNSLRCDATTALWMAAQMGHDNIVRLLMKNGANLDINNQDGISALFKACHKGHEQVVRELLQGNPCLGIGKNGSSPLHAAVWSANESVVRLLLSAGADSNMKDRRQMSAGQLARKLQLWNVLEYFDNTKRRGSFYSSSPSPTSF